MTFRANDSSGKLIDDFDDHLTARKAAEKAGPGSHVVDESGVRLSFVPPPITNFCVDDTPNRIGEPAFWSPGN